MHIHIVNLGMWFFLLAALLLTIHPVSADIDEKEYAKCAAIKGSLKRLVCYDELAKRKKSDQPLTSILVGAGAGLGKWQDETRTDSIDDSKTIFRILDADSGKSRYGDKISIVVACSYRTVMAINWHEYLGTNEAKVITRIGKTDARRRIWSISKDSKSTFHPDGGVTSFLRLMMSADRFTAQVTPYGENPVTAVFDTTGMRNAMKPLAEMCNWSLDVSEDPKEYGYDENSLKTNKLICEHLDGYLQATVRAPYKVAEYAISINAVRKKEYSIIANEKSLSLDEIAKLEAQKKTKSSPRSTCK